MTDARALATVLAAPANFSIEAVRHNPAVARAFAAPAPLGPLAAFTGNWTGNGFNTIFRPYAKEPNTPDGNPDDAVLELNLTSETMSFGPPLGNIPNRGFNTQEDICLNGVPYLQTINDVTTLPA